jgi:uncharacterized protein (DUF1697 family)
MKKFIVLLRGINVSGQKKINMKELKSYFEELGFDDVVTYIQSGNVIFNSKNEHKPKLKKMIEKMIFDKYNFDVKTIIITSKELVKILEQNPFKDKYEQEENKLYFTFLFDKVTDENLAKLNSMNFDSEYFSFKENIIYLYTPNGYGRAKLNNNFIENKLKVDATTRNLKTVSKLIELSE